MPFSDLVEKDGRWLRVNASGGATQDYTEQRQAVEAMLKTTDQVFALRGVAGAGKTTALKEFHAGVRAAGRMHILLAPTTKAVEALKREISGARVTTVESFLLSQKARGTGAIGVLGKIAFSSLKDAVITVDEWGLLSNRAGHELLRIAKEQGVLVRFVGDTRQHVAVEAGDFGSKTGHLLCKSDRWLENSCPSSSDSKPGAHRTISVSRGRRVAESARTSRPAPNPSSMGSRAFRPINRFAVIALTEFLEKHPTVSIKRDPSRPGPKGFHA